MKLFDHLFDQHLFRYVVNGLLATAVHFAFLYLFVDVLFFSSAGLANFLAAFAGIASSFLGNRFFVFQKTDDGIVGQYLKFLTLYAVIAVLHGLVLYVWTDVYGYDYRLGFIIATIIQFISSYLGNKKFVFNS